VAGAVARSGISCLIPFGGICSIAWTDALMMMICAGVDADRALMADDRAYLDGALMV